eukprot:XP_014770877.1 PREDICTED: histone-lysine N-methyltransferase SETMAR-like [Octopus bimaculoides]
MDCLANGTTINESYYASPLQKLREVIKVERRDMLTKGARLFQDTTPIHNAHVAQMKAHYCGYEIFPHPPYSPDLAPSDFHLFPIMKSFLKRKHFSDDDELISGVKTWLETQPTDFYRRGLRSCIMRWENCVTMKGKRPLSDINDSHKLKTKI